MYQTDPAAAALAANASAQISLTVVDARTSQPALEVGVATSLNVTLTNSGAALPLVAGGGASVLTLYLPGYVPVSELPGMSISLTDWTFASSSAEGCLTLTYTGAEPGSWIGNLAFTITGVSAPGPQADGSFQVNFQNIAGAPPQIIAPLPLIAAPQSTYSLADVLQVSLDSLGTVYVTSDAHDPLANTLYLNIKNTLDVPVYSGSTLPSGAEIAVSFVYGNTSGALAPAEATQPAQPPIGSAWGIVGGRYADQTDGWHIAPATSSDPAPIWRLTPTTTNTNLFGTGASANVTFSFSNIVSMTAVGHTQMTLTFRNFPKSDTENYDPWVVVLDIVKQPPPATRGLLSFFGTCPPIMPVASQTAKNQVPLRWSMAQVNEVQIFSSFPVAASDSKALAPSSLVYATAPNSPAPLATDAAEIELTGVTQSGPATFTLQARDGQGAYLNALQYSCYLQMQVFVDPRDNREYPIALINGKWWMTENLAFMESGSVYYNNYSPNASFGQLYPANALSMVAPPAGWQVPSLEDWTGLDTNAIAAFDGQLGGWSVGGQFNGLTQQGYYWVNGGGTYAQYSGPSSPIVTGGSVTSTMLMSIRYVRDL